MTRRLENVLAALDSLENTARDRSPLHGLDARAKLLVAAVFLASMLSVPLERASQVLLYAVFPALAAAAANIRYRTLLLRSTFVLPLVVLIGVFDVFTLRAPLFVVGPVVVTQGWGRLLVLALRAMLSVQALLVLTETTGIYRICCGLRRLGIPALFTAQLLLVYRYLYVLIEESISLVRARDARSFGRKGYPLRIWGTLVGQLLIRSVERAERIGRAMYARGFTGELPAMPYGTSRWTRRDTVFAIVWSAALLALRFLRPVEALAIWILD